MTVMDGPTTFSVEPCAAVMLVTAGLSTEDLRVQPVASGGNNRSYRVTAGGTNYHLKEYFHHDADTRDRLGTEFGFLRWAWRQGVRSVPRPIARHFFGRIGLYEWIEGHPVLSHEVDAAMVDAAADLVVQLNRNRGLGAELPAASDACFSMDDHLVSVERRVVALSSGVNGAGADNLVREKVEPIWVRVSTGLRDQQRASAWACAECDRVISPSDFGFHNAIRLRSGGVRFVDFEYAGWDDAAKLVADFYHQVAVPVPRSTMDGFVAKLRASLGLSEDCERRLRLIESLYRLKWACMVLSELLPISASRRRFARRGGTAAESRQSLTDRALQMLLDLERVL